MTKQNNGIFCIEGLWESDLRKQSTVRPILELLRLNEGVRYIHRESATIEELEFYISAWTQKRYSSYPILYLAFHGDVEEISPSRKPYDLDEIAEILGDRCHGRLVMISSCSTLATDKRRLKTFLRNTSALAICGYQNDVGWMLSTAFELLFFSELQENEFSGRGIKAIETKIRKLARSFEGLDFRIVTKQELG